MTISLILCITAQYCRANSFALNMHAGNRLLSPASSPVQVFPGLLLASLGLAATRTATIPVGRSGTV